MASFDPGLGSGATAPPAVTTAATSQTREEQRAPSGGEMAAQMRELLLEVQQLRTMVASQATIQVPASVTLPDAPARLTPTEPNATGELPPAEVRYLTLASFPEGAKKA
ncbi:unnamed protein product [Phytophthora fragariaefolia]|uniref:Unnamed protein product n=1 Tax=Phytophthora fragariaefolia TaxID=1490495 RepID=A0A9W6YHD2_9STRA|nr:unnamed protein product [Phytophthora fragariaefolia]